jgi:hypothetical protein
MSTLLNRILFFSFLFTQTHCLPSLTRNKVVSDCFSLYHGKMVLVLANLLCSGNFAVKETVSVCMTANILCTDHVVCH